MTSFIALWRHNFQYLADNLITWFLLGSAFALMTVDFAINGLGFSSDAIIFLLFSIFCYFAGFTVGVFMQWYTACKEN
jgi:hypothetical protein